MGTTRRRGDLRAIPILLVSMFVLAGLAPAIPGSTVAARLPSGRVPVDLALVTLGPADLAALHMPGYGIGFGQTLYPKDFEWILERRGLSEDQARPAIEGSGFVR